jgi:HSP20 family protein
MLIKFERTPAFTPLFNDIFQFERDVDRMFGTFMGNTSGAVAGGYPAIELRTSNEESVLLAELPGVKKEDLKLSVENGTLILSGTRGEQSIPENSRWLRNELWHGGFSRSIELPHDVNTEKISATLENGILRVQLPKAEAVRPREITIR